MMNKFLLRVTAGILIFLPLLLPSPSLAAPPTNDDFDSATTIPELPFTDNMDATDATWSQDDPQDCSSNGSVWYSYTPSTDLRIEANTFGSSYDTVLSVYTGSRGALSMLYGACNDDYEGLQSYLHFDAVGGTTYYFLIATCCGSGNHGGGNLHFVVQELEVPPPPENDNFADAMTITQLPFSDTFDNSGAGLEASEPIPNCVSRPDLTSTTWYAYTSVDDRTVTALFGAQFQVALAVYTGSSLSNLSELDCYRWGGPLSIQTVPGTTYYFQVSSLYRNFGSVWFDLDYAPPPRADFWFYPQDPSAFDTIHFSDWSWDEAHIGVETYAWDFGDGTTETGCCPTHRYERDGDYEVQFDIVTFDGRSASTSKIIEVRTHDVAITKLNAPRSAVSGQTRQITVEINNKRYPGLVEVRLYKSVQGGFEYFGSLTQLVPVRPSNRTTTFKFTYTFTSEDADIGKITFKAIANTLDRRDAWPADNELIAPPTKLFR